MPGGDGGGVEAEGVGERAEAVLGVVGGAGVVVAEAPPDRGGEGGVEAGEDQRALGQAGDGGHEGAGGAARAGGAGDDDRVRGRLRRPGGGEGLGGGAEAALALGGAGGGEVAAEEREEAEAALPVGGVLGGVDGGEGGGGDALALHLVEELGEAVGEVEGGGAGGEVGLGGGEAGDEAGELELAAQRGDRRRQVGGAERVVGELGDDADAGEEARGAFGEDRGERAGGAAGVGPESPRAPPPRAAGRRGGRRGRRRARGRSRRRGEREDARAGGGKRLIGRATAAGRACGASLHGVQAPPAGYLGQEMGRRCDVGRRRVRRACSGRAALIRQLGLGERDAFGAADVDPAAGVDDAAELAAAISASQTGLSEKASAWKPASAAGSRICAPA